MNTALDVITEDVSEMEASSPIKETRQQTGRSPTVVAQPPSGKGFGPGTTEGKAASRRNALKHGLTATKLLSEVLEPGKIEQYEKELSREYNPATLTERFLIAELARHAAALDFGEEAEGAVLRHGALELAHLVFRGDQLDGADRDALLSAAVATDTLERFSRYRRAHEKAFFAALNKLDEMKQARKEAEEKLHEAAESHFQTEAACQSYLERRFQRAEHQCPHCRSRSGRWLATRGRWQCDDCKRQAGLRAGTVMAVPVQRVYMTHLGGSIW